MRLDDPSVVKLVFKLRACMSAAHLRAGKLLLPELQRLRKKERGVLLAHVAVELGKEVSTLLTYARAARFVGAVPDAAMLCVTTLSGLVVNTGLRLFKCPSPTAVSAARKAFKNFLEKGGKPTAALAACVAKETRTVRSKYRLRACLPACLLPPRRNKGGREKGAKN